MSEYVTAGRQDTESTSPQRSEDIGSTIDGGDESTESSPSPKGRGAVLSKSSERNDDERETGTGSACVRRSSIYPVERDRLFNTFSVELGEQFFKCRIHGKLIRQDDLAAWLESNFKPEAWTVSMRQNVWYIRVERRGTSGEYWTDDQWEENAVKLLRRL